GAGVARAKSQAATEAAASEPGPSITPPTKRTKGNMAEQAAEPTQPAKASKPTRMARSIGGMFLLLLAACTVSLAQYEYDDGYGYGYDFYDSEDDFAGGDETGAGASGSLGGGDDLYDDQYGYYGDEDEQYYEYYGYYADDFAGYEDYYSDEYEIVDDCSENEAGKPTLTSGTATCDIKISGIDKQADKLVGGLDGVYKLVACHNGKAMYKRSKSPAGEDRVLWYSSAFGDWDISKGTDPNDQEILMYGGEMEHATVPLFVSSWHLGNDLKTNSVSPDDDFLPVNVKVVCADGKVYKETATAQKVGPVLTDAEMEAKYRYIYDKYSRSADPSPTINFTFVVVLVMIGLTIVLAIPYFLLKKKGGPAGKPTSISSSFAQMLTQSKKKQSGHTN
ncbi:hypothetical protein QJQ45_018849, partial [Haematococcus lacustris]